MAAIELFVRHKTVDLVAATARGTIARDMGYGERLLGLDREDYWRIEVAAEGEGAVRLAEELAHRTKLFVNPNKHTCRIRVDGSPVGGSAEPAGAEGGHVVCALVHFRDDEKAELAADTLRRTLGYGDTIRSVTRGTWWRLEIAAAAPDEARRIAEEIVVTRGVDEGLLMNPHSQEYRLL